MHGLQGWVARKDRLSVAIDAVALRADGTKAPVKVIDYSEHGCRLETDAEFGIGERLQIAMPRMGNVKAQVRWAIHGKVGARFVVESDF
jgi:hypothetical protein